MKTFTKLSIVISSLLLIALVVPSSSVLGRIAEDYIWDGHEIGPVAFAAFGWYGLHILVVFRKSDFYSRHQRKIVIALIGLILISSAGAAGLYSYAEYRQQKHEITQKKERKIREEERARRINLAKKCEQGIENADTNEFCAQYIEFKYEAIGEIRKSILKDHTVHLDEKWREFLFRFRNQNWVKIVRSTQHGDYVCLDLVTPLKVDMRSVNLDSLDETQLKYVDDLADKFLEYLNVDSRASVRVQLPLDSQTASRRNKSQSKYSIALENLLDARESMNLESTSTTKTKNDEFSFDTSVLDGGAHVVVDTPLLWTYEDLRLMTKSNDPCTYPNKFGPGFLYRANRYKKVIELK